MGVQQPSGKSRPGSSGGGTKEEQASGCRERAWFVPVGIADEVTKRTWSSPKALTASCDRCYCPRQSNTTAWVRRERAERQESTHKIQRAASSPSRRTDTGRSGGLVETEARGGEKQEVALANTHTLLHLRCFTSSFCK